MRLFRIFWLIVLFFGSFSRVITAKASRKKVEKNSRPENENLQPILIDTREESKFFPDLWNILGKVDGMPKYPSTSRGNDSKVMIDPDMVRVEGPDRMRPVEVSFENPSIWEVLKERSNGKVFVFNLRNTSSVPIYGDLSAHITTKEPNNLDDISNEDIAQKIIFLNATLTELQKKLKNSTNTAKDGKCEVTNPKLIGKKF